MERRKTPVFRRAIAPDEGRCMSCDFHHHAIVAAKFVLPLIRPSGTFSP
jgi:hypothetical protein